MLPCLNGLYPWSADTKCCLLPTFLSPFDWCGIYGLAWLAFIDFSPCDTCRHWRIDQPHEIARPSYTRVPSEMVYFRYFVMEAANIGSGGSLPFFMESNYFGGTRINLSERLQFNVTKVTSMDISYSSASFLMVSLLFIVSFSCRWLP